MAPSARAIVAAGAAAAAATGLAGCVTTQDRNARAQLNANRVLAARKPVRVTRQTPDVRIGRVALVRGHRRSAVVVELANATGRVLSDLPISVRARVRHKHVLLNRRDANDYFANHVAALGPHARVRWVLTTRRRLPAGTRLRAVVGAPERRWAALPVLGASAAPGPPAGVRVRVRNGTAVPQGALPVYALARRGHRYVAAGAAVVDQLDQGAAVTVDVPLVGRPGGGRLQLQVLPTIFK